MDKKDGYSTLLLVIVVAVLGLAAFVGDRARVSYDGVSAKSTAHGAPRSPEWPKVEKAWLAKHPTCAACGGTKSLQVHHKKPFSEHPELELDEGNLITLCEYHTRNCHLTWGHMYDFKHSNPNVEEDVIRWRREVEKVTGP